MIENLKSFLFSAIQYPEPTVWSKLRTYSEESICLGTRVIEVIPGKDRDGKLAVRDKKSDFYLWYIPCKIGWISFLTWAWVSRPSFLFQRKIVWIILYAASLELVTCLLIKLVSRYFFRSYPYKIV